jgi:hypothetical protein
LEKAGRFYLVSRLKTSRPGSGSPAFLGGSRVFYLELPAENHPAGQRMPGFPWRKPGFFIWNPLPKPSRRPGSGCPAFLGESRAILFGSPALNPAGRAAADRK